MRLICFALIFRRAGRLSGSSRRHLPLQPGTTMRRTTKVEENTLGKVMCICQQSPTSIFCIRYSDKLTETGKREGQHPILGREYNALSQ